MIVKIRQFFEQHIITIETDTDETLQQRLQQASAALMIEIIYADHKVEAEELDALRRVIQHSFGLSTAETNELIELADQERREATDYYQFTALINEHYSQQQKRELVTRLWQLAFANDNVHKLEEHLIRRLADLLHVPHSAFMQSKHQAMTNNN
jgi:uncharacterized tellurite resistance protein B-like protein